VRNYITVLAVVLSMSPLAGASAGTGRKSDHARSAPEAVTRTYHAEENPDLTPEKALQQQNGAIQQYSKMGYQLEAKRQWEKAELAFQYVLKVSAIRDGVGSPKMVPILQHLAVVMSEQGRMREAIGFQERVFGFAKNKTDQLQIINAGTALTNLYLRLPDIDKAESTAQEVYRLSQDTVSLPGTKKQEVAHFYGTVLRKIHKDGQAELVDPIASSGASSKDASNKDPLNKDAANKDASNKDASHKDPANKEASIKDASSKDTSNKDATNKEASTSK
jgi:tetratricopeptide (TPR) repeat protein